MIDRARAGKFDQYKSDISYPQVPLVQELYSLGHPDFAQRVINGEFEPEEWEANEWASSDEGRLAFAELVEDATDDHMRGIIVSLFEGFEELADPSPGRQWVQVAEVNTEAVEAVADRGFETITDLINKAAVSELDVLMISHNLHCWLIQAVEDAAGMNAEQKLRYRKMAVDTFVKAMEERP